MPSRTKEPPYLTHAISHHGRVTLVPPDNAGRIRKPTINGEKSARRHQERSHEQQQSGSTTTVSPHIVIPNRRLFEDSRRYSIPNYPPPSFQEAMATPPVSTAPSVVSDDTGTFLTAAQSFDDEPNFALELNLTEEELSRLSTTAAYGSTLIADQPTSPRSSDSDSSSISSSSIEIVESATQISIQTSLSGQSTRQSSPTSPRDGSYSVVERELGSEGYTMPSTPSKHGHHRSLSLSPLRTLLPSHSRSSSTGTFIRSSTSTSNLLARAASSPFFRSTTTLGSPTNESPRKKIFKREKERQRLGDEPMDSWEMLDAASGSEGPSPPPSSNRMSIMSAGPSSARSGTSRRPHPSPPPIHIPQQYSSSVPALQIHRTDSPPIVTVRTRRFPSSRVHVPSPLAHDAVLETALNVPLPSTPRGRTNADPETPITAGPPTPTRRHYAGRPLPRPPGIDGAAAHLLTQPLTPPAWVTSLPPQYPPAPAPVSAPAPTTPRESTEQLLIDFRDSVVLEDPVTTPQTPQAPRRRHRIDLLSDTDEESEMMSTPPQSPVRVSSPARPRTPVTPTPSSRSPPLPRDPYSQLTELDMLAASLSDEGMRTGQEYETLLLIAEFNGPATPTGTRTRRNALASPPRSAASSIIFPSTEGTSSSSHSPSHQHPFMQAAIELERRRVTKDGRVKLKLSLLGFAVDKCGICFAQFKKGEVGAKGRSCQPGHAFHGMCLQKWVAATAREPRCPVCREPLKP